MPRESKNERRNYSDGKRVCIIIGVMCDSMRWGDSMSTRRRAMRCNKLYFPCIRWGAECNSLLIMHDIMCGNRIKANGIAFNSIWIKSIVCVILRTPYTVSPSCLHRQEGMHFVTDADLIISSFRFIRVSSHFSSFVICIANVRARVNRTHTYKWNKLLGAVCIASSGFGIR